MISSLGDASRVPLVTIQGWTTSLNRPTPGHIKWETARRFNQTSPGAKKRLIEHCGSNLFKQGSLDSPFKGCNLPVVSMKIATFGGSDIRTKGRPKRRRLGQGEDLQSLSETRCPHAPPSPSRNSRAKHRDTAAVTKPDARYRG